MKPALESCRAGQMVDAHSAARTARLEEVRRKALQDLQRFEVLMLGGHFDYGNGYHGEVYLNPHKLFQQPSTIWRLAQDLIDLLPPELVRQTEVVAGPVTGGALLAHTIAGLLDGRRSLTHPACRFAPFNLDRTEGLTLRPVYRELVAGRRVLLADDIRNTGKSFERCASLVREAAGTVLGTVEIYDRLALRQAPSDAEPGRKVTLPQAQGVDLAVPNIALAEYRGPANYRADECPLCRAGRPITAF